MAKTDRAEGINPAILGWARESAGLSLEEAAQKLTLQPAKLSCLEHGNKIPTYKQLGAMASTYRRPLITFYLDRPPVKSAVGEDFRTQHGVSHPRQDANLEALLRDLKSRQRMLSEIVQEEDDSSALAFVGSHSVAQGVEPLVASLAQSLEYRPKGDSLGADRLFKELRSRTEHLGVFVLLYGNLGSSHTSIPSKTFRGIAIADPYAPLVCINSNDAKASRSFTLLHELAHIFLGRTGLSGPIEATPSEDETARIELFCNDVAGEFLLPTQQLQTITLPRDPGEASIVVQKLAAQWSVSEPLVLYKLKRLGKASHETYRQLASDYARRWSLQAEQEREKPSKGGPSYYAVRRSYLGEALVSIVRTGLNENTLTHTKAAKLLGVKPNLVDTLTGRNQ